MTAGLDQRAFEVFDAVCDLPADEQERALAERCGEGTELRRLVEGMLERDATMTQAEGLAPGSGGEMLAGEIAESGIFGMAAAHPERIGRYRVVREIGRGGMGVVYEARQEAPSRRVAVKVVRGEYASRETMRRFKREAELLGRLEHPGIAQIFEAGSDDTGTAFFAMEYVDGRPLDAFIRDHNLERLDMVRLFERVCDAVHHAHQKGIIHRDLKPANVLVRMPESDTTAGALLSGSSTSSGSRSGDDHGPRPKILDFGVARLADTGGESMTMHTHAGQLVGTPAYMSPEQIDADPSAIDARSDVYAIGVMLYQALAGRMPFDVADKPLPEAVRILREGVATPLGAIDRTLRGDLETIVATAMERDQTRRYASVAALGDDLRRFRVREPITARPASVAYQFGRLAARNRTLFGGIAATFVVLLAGLIATGMLLLREQDARTEAEVATERVQEVADFQSRMLANIDVTEMGRRIAQRVREEKAKTSSAELSDVGGINIAREVLTEFLATRAAEALDDGAASDPLVEAELRTAIASIFFNNALPAETLEQHQKALDLIRSVYGTDHPISLEAELLYATALGSALDKVEVVEFLRQLVRRSESVLGADDRLTLDVKISLGATLLSFEAPEETAEGGEILAAVLPLLRRYADESSNVLLVEGMLADVLERTGRVDEALAEHRRLIEIESERWGERDSGVSTLRQSYAVLLLRHGYAEEAERQIDLAYEGHRESLGDHNHATIVTGYFRGNLRVLIGRYADAEAPLRRAIEDAEGHYEAELFSVYFPKMLLSWVLAETGGHEEGVRWARAALDGMARAQGLGERNRYHAQYWLARNLEGLGEVSGAVAGYARIAGEPNRERPLPELAVAAALRVSAVSVANDETLYAIAVLRSAIRHATDTLGPDHPSTRMLKDELDRLQ